MAEARDPNSQEAWERIQHVWPDLLAKYLGIVRDHPDGCTCEEVEDETGDLHQTVSPALLHLRRVGAIERNGRKKNRSQRSAWIYQITGSRPLHKDPDQTDLFGDNGDDDEDDDDE